MWLEYLPGLIFTITDVYNAGTFWNSFATTPLYMKVTDAQVTDYVIVIFIVLFANSSL